MPLGSRDGGGEYPDDQLSACFRSVCRGEVSQRLLGKTWDREGAWPWSLSVITCFLRVACGGGAWGSLSLLSVRRQSCSKSACRKGWRVEGRVLLPDTTAGGPAYQLGGCTRVQDGSQGSGPALVMVRGLEPFPCAPRDSALFCCLLFNDCPVDAH